MDYEGQRLSELLYYWIIIAFGVFGWIWGFIQEDFKLTLYSWGVGVAISVLLCVPDWPIYNRNPVKWNESIADKRNGSLKSGGNVSTRENSEAKKKKNKKKA